MVLELGDSLPPPSGAVIIGSVYELTVYTSEYSSTPSPVIISPPATMVLAYDPDELPENTSSVFIAYYDEEQGWTKLDSPNGLVAEVGKATAQVSHFTPFAVIAELAPCPLPAETSNLGTNPNQVVGTGECAIISAPPATPAAMPIPPAPPVDAGGYSNLMLAVVIYAVSVAFAVTIARLRLQRKRLERALNLERGWFK